MELDEFLRKSLEDRRFSRAERKALTQHLVDTPEAAQRIDYWCSRAAQLAKGEAGSIRGRELVTWLYEVSKVLSPRGRARTSSRTETYFSPGEGPRRRIISLIRGARESVDCCVFTITDNDIVDALLETHRRGIAVRVISDDLKSEDRGSDIVRLVRAGIDVKLDDSPAHMHHKFALFDGKVLLNGSYNWTRSAAKKNEENILVTDDSTFVEAFTQMFESLWSQYGLEQP